MPETVKKPLAGAHRCSAMEGQLMVMEYFNELRELAGRKRLQEMIDKIVDKNTPGYPEGIEIGTIDLRDILNNK